jgi:hypothetical protein
VATRGRARGDGRGKVSVDEQDLVARPQVQAVGEQIKAVGRTVAENDLVGPFALAGATSCAIGSRAASAATRGNGPW